MVKRKRIIALAATVALTVVGLPSTANASSQAYCDMRVKDEQDNVERMWASEREEANELQRVKDQIASEKQALETQESVNADTKAYIVSWEKQEKADADYNMDKVALRHANDRVQKAQEKVKKAQQAEDKAEDALQNIDLPKLKSDVTRGDALGFLTAIGHPEVTKYITDSSLNKYTAANHIGSRGDATSLANLQNAAKDMQKVNSLRASDNQIGPVPPLKVGYEMLAIAMGAANEARVHMGHTGQSDGYPGFESESLAWTAGDPLGGPEAWYSEKNEYTKALSGKPHGEAGHYASMLDDSYPAMGVAVNTIEQYNNTSAAEYGEDADGTLTTGTFSKLVNTYSAAHKNSHRFQDFVNAYTDFLKEDESQARSDLQTAQQKLDTATQAQAQALQTLKDANQTLVNTHEAYDSLTRIIANDVDVEKLDSLEDPLFQNIYYLPTYQESVDDALKYVHKAEKGLTKAKACKVTADAPQNPSQPATAYSDVQADEWYAPAVAYMFKHNLMTGYKNGKFGPADPVTREQAAIILYRIAGTPEAGDDVSEYPDGSLIDNWATRAVAWAAQTGTMNGYGPAGSGAKFGPTDDLTREQAAKIIAIASQKYEEPSQEEKDRVENMTGAMGMNPALVGYMTWAVRNKIINGWPDKWGLQPRGRVSRAQMAQIIENAEKNGILG